MQEVTQTTQLAASEKIETLLTRRQVEQICGLSVATIYRSMDTGTFPRPIKIAGGAVRWLKSDIDQMIAQRVAERDADQDAA